MSEHKLLLFDGVCGLCNHLVDFLIRHDRRDQLRFASLQSETGRAIVTRHGGDPEELNTVYLVSSWNAPGERVLVRGKAIFHALHALGGLWRVPGLLRFFPAFVLDIGYRLVASVRYRLWGKLETCSVPTAATRAKFIDS